MIAEAWGFYHSLQDENLRRVLLIPLMKQPDFSYDDEKRQKLSRSPVQHRGEEQKSCSARTGVSRSTAACRRGWST